MNDIRTYCKSCHSVIMYVSKKYSHIFSKVYYSKTNWSFYPCKCNLTFHPIHERSSYLNLSEVSCPYPRCTGLVVVTAVSSTWLARLRLAWSTLNLSTSCIETSRRETVSLVRTTRSRSLTLAWVAACTAATTTTLKARPSSPSDGWPGRVSYWWVA